MSITLVQYFLDKKNSLKQLANANLLLAALNLFLRDCADLGHYAYEIDPDTGAQISGSKGGAGDGGFRTPSSTTGSKLSTHRDANGADVSDTLRLLATFCVTTAGKELLAKHGLWMEDPRWTPCWCHLQRVPPSSGKRIYIPSISKPLAPALPGQPPIPFTIKKEF